MVTALPRVSYVAALVIIGTLLYAAINWSAVVSGINSAARWFLGV